MKHRVIKGNDDEMLAVVYPFQQFLEVEGYALFVEYAEGLRDDDGRDKYDGFPFFAFFKYRGCFLAELGAVREPS